MWLKALRQAGVALGFLVLVTGGVSLLCGPAHAQDGALTTARFSDDMIERAARVYVAIRDIRRQYQQKMQSIDDPARAAPLQRERRAQIDKLIREHDLTRAKYEEITTAAQSNRELYNRLKDAIERVEEQSSNS